jgi:hypothetical protein
LHGVKLSFSFSSYWFVRQLFAKFTDGQDGFFPIAFEGHSSVIKIHHRGRLVFTDFIDLNPVSIEPMLDRSATVPCAASRRVNDHAVGLAKNGDGFFRSMDWRVGNGLLPLPSRSVAWLELPSVILRFRNGRYRPQTSVRLIIRFIIQTASWAA